MNFCLFCTHGSGSLCWLGPLNSPMSLGNSLLGISSLVFLIFCMELGDHKHSNDRALIFFLGGGGGGDSPFDDFVKVQKWPENRRFQLFKFASFVFLDSFPKPGILCFSTCCPYYSIVYLRGIIS